MKPTQRTLLLVLAAGAALIAAAPRPEAAATLPRDTREFVRQFGKLLKGQADEVLRQIERGPRDLAAQRAAARREGIPLKPVDLQAPLPPADRNAAPIYVQLMRLLQEKPLDAETDPIRGSLSVHVAHPMEAVARVQKLLTERQDVMALVHEAAGKPECVFQRDWSRGTLMEFPGFATMREAARLLKAESFFLAREGRFQEAIDNQVLGLRIANHAAGEPGLIAQFVSVACQAIALSGMENILCLAGPDAGVAEAVRKAMATHRLPIRLSRALKGEVVLFSAGYTIMRKGGPEAAALMEMAQDPTETPTGPGPILEDVSKLTPHQRQLRSQAIDAMEAGFIGEMRALIARCDEPLPAFKPFVQHLLDRQRHPSWNPLVQQSQIMSPVFGQASSRIALARAREAVLMAGASVLIHRAQHGMYPDRLEAALTQPILEPFTEKPLPYRREAEGFVVYSVGEDGHFDGGRPSMRRDNRQAYFRYPATPLPPLPPQG
jgi:hypothetical protein